MLGSLGFFEIAFVLVLALLLFGPKRLPEIGRTLGKGMAEFRRASTELKRTLEREVEIDAADQRSAARAAATSAPAEVIATLPLTLGPAGEPPTAEAEANEAEPNAAEPDEAEPSEVQPSASLPPGAD